MLKMDPPKKKALALNPTCELSTVNAHPLSAKHADTPLAGTEGLSSTRCPGGGVVAQHESASVERCVLLSSRYLTAPSR